MHAILSRGAADSHTVAENRSYIALGMLIFCVAFAAINVYILSTGAGFFNESARFSGISYHPNQFGAIAAISTLMTIAFGPIFFSGKLAGIMIGLVAAANLFLTLASGSRGALLSVALGFTFIAICKKINPIFLGMCAILSVVVYQLFALLTESSGEIIDRLQSTGDNRSEVFSRLLQSFLENPLYGAGSNADGSENAILKALAIGGLVCGIPMACFIATRIWLVLVALTAYIRLPAVRPSTFSPDIGSDAIIFSVLASSMADGYLFEKFGFAHTGDNTPNIIFWACSSSNTKIDIPS